MTRSESMKQRWQDPAKRQALLDARAAADARNPGRGERISAAQRERWARIKAEKQQ